MKKVIVMILSLGLLLVGCSEGSKEEKEPVKSEYTIGETVELEKLNVTLNNVRYVETDEFFKPEAGEVWIALEFTFENTSEESQYIAGIFEITLRDDEGRDKEMNIWGELEGSLDGDVMPQEKLTGEKSFTLKESDTTLTAYYKSTFAKEPVKFVFTTGDIK